MKQNNVRIILQAPYFSRSISDLIQRKNWCPCSSSTNKCKGGKRDSNLRTTDRPYCKSLHLNDDRNIENTYSRQNMSEAFLFLGPAMVMCLVLSGIHVYLGMHILAREVIFVDLSLAQLAIFGAVIASLSGYEDNNLMLHLGAFGFTIPGAAIFAFTRHAKHRVSQEAIVGIVYAVASALMILILGPTPHGAEKIKTALAGDLIVATWGQIWKDAIIYGILAILHIILAQRFISISWNKKQNGQKNTPHRMVGFFILSVVWNRDHNFSPSCWRIARLFLSDCSRCHHATISDKLANTPVCRLGKCSGRKHCRIMVILGFLTCLPVQLLLFHSAACYFSPLSSPLWLQHKNANLSLHLPSNQQKTEGKGLAPPSV